MDLGVPTFNTEKKDAEKLLNLWWDVVIHYLTVAMMAISLSAIGLQFTKDGLICIPAVNCSALARNQSVLLASRTADPKLNAICSKLLNKALNEGPRPTTVFATMADRRQYDYVDSECYSKLPDFPKFFSFIFFWEALVILIISNFWLVYPETSTVLRRFESLLAELLARNDLATICDDFVGRKYGTEEAVVREKREFYYKARNFLARYLEVDIRYSKISSVSFQYKLRVGLGSIVSLAYVIFNLTTFNRTSNYNQCRLEKAVFLTEYIDEYFECSRFIDNYYHAVTYIFSALLIPTILAFLQAFFWSICSPKSPLPWKAGEAEFLFRVLKKSSKTGVWCHDNFVNILQMFRPTIKTVSGDDDEANAPLVVHPLLKNILDPPLDQANAPGDIEGNNIKANARIDIEGYNIEANVPRDREEIDVEANAPRDREEIDIEANVPRDREEFDIEANVPRDRDEIDIEANAPRDREEIDIEANAPHDREEIDTEANVPRDREEIDIEANAPHDREEIDIEANVPRDREEIDTEANAPFFRTTYV